MRAELESKLAELDLALKFSLASLDHAGTRRDVKKAQSILGELRALLSQAVPDCVVYAVIDSMGWDLDGQEKDDMYRLCRAMLAAEQAPRALFTVIGKGGRYELLGESSGAGGCRREVRVIYRCLDTGQLYHRTDDDFAARMTPLNEEGEA